MNPTNTYQFPQPKYEEGQHVQSVHSKNEKGVIAAVIYTTSNHTSLGYSAGFSYCIDFYSPHKVFDVLHESEVLSLEEAASSLSIAVPESVPAPKFQLFEEAYYGKHKGTITGMAYENPLEALRQSSQPGWRYDLSYSFGRTPLEAVSVDEDDTLIYEDSLSRCAH